MNFHRLTSLEVDWLPDSGKPHLAFQGMSFRHPCIGQRVAMFSLHKITLTYLFVFLFSPSLELATSSTLCKKANNHIFSFKETQRRTGSIKSVRIFRGFTALSHFKLAMASLHPCFYNIADEPEINEWEMVHIRLAHFCVGAESTSPHLHPWDTAVILCKQNGRPHVFCWSYHNAFSSSKWKFSMQCFS